MKSGRDDAKNRATHVPLTQVPVQANRKIAGAPRSSSDTLVIKVDASSAMPVITFPELPSMTAKIFQKPRRGDAQPSQQPLQRATQKSGPSEARLHRLDELIAKVEESIEKENRPEKSTFEFKLFG